MFEISKPIIKLPDHIITYQFRDIIWKYCTIIIKRYENTNNVIERGSNFMV